ncbi:MAG: thioredoxin domain-containing protein [Chthonomonadales bacterium]
MPNRLAHQTSPYLLQHAHNPVDWYPWGEEALTRARTLDIPILLSVGYSACHWCHVMERESFENEQIAAQMNAGYVCIKVDREERPDIDHLYMSAVQMMTGQGGWPMTVFLTPDGEPFYGGTYFPPEDRYGRPGFPKILNAVTEAWRSSRSEIIEQGAAMAKQISEMGRAQAAPSDINTGILDRAFERLESVFDEEHGGFGSAPKFPQPMNLDFLLRYASRTGNKRATEMVSFTLRRMALGGIFDQLDGGFARYSTDTYWLVPHFEKMLYDNAQLVQSLVRCWQMTGEPLFREAAESTLNHLIREMTHPDGGFYSAQDADSEGVEGKYFVWTPKEIQAALGIEDSTLFCRIFDVTPHGNWEHTNILNLSSTISELAGGMDKDPKELQEFVDRCKAKLFALRETRIKPGLDDKILTGWNGLAIAAFAEASRAFGRPDYENRAAEGARFILSTLYASNRLYRTGKFVGDGAGTFQRAPIFGFLEDYANMSDAMLELYLTDFNPDWLKHTRELTDAMLDLFWEDGRLFNTPKDGETLIDRPRDVMDNAVPSGQSVAIGVLIRLNDLTGDTRYGQISDQILATHAVSMAQHPQAFGRLLCGLDMALGPLTEVTIAGDPTDKSVQTMLTSVRSEYRPNLLCVIAPPTGAPGLNPDWTEGRGPVEGKPAAYVCRDQECKPPVTFVDDLLTLLNAG